jgi:hypothetical protein
VFDELNEIFVKKINHEYFGGSNVMNVSLVVKLRDSGLVHFFEERTKLKRYSEITLPLKKTLKIMKTKKKINNLSHLLMKSSIKLAGKEGYFSRGHRELLDG